MARKHKSRPVPLVPAAAELQVIINEVLGTYKILPGAYKLTLHIQ